MNALKERDEKKVKLQQEFDDKQYFKYVTSGVAPYVTSKKAINQARMNGQIKLNISKALTQAEKIRAYANDEYAYYLHKNGIMHKQLSGKKYSVNKSLTQEDMDQVFNQSIRFQYKTLEQE